MQLLPITPASTNPDVQLESISPAQRKLWRASEALKTIVVMGVAWWAENFVHSMLAVGAKLHEEVPGVDLVRWWPFPFGTLMLLAAAWRAYAIIILPGRKYRSWGWTLADGELHVRRGFWTITHTVVPLHNIQHVDTSQGPLERRFGVSQLVVHTAGVGTANVKLVGLPTETALALRDAIRAAAAAEKGNG